MRKFLLAMTALFVAFVAAPVAGAATISVTTVNDELGGNPAACSLREAISSANTNSATGGCTAGLGADVIQLPAGEYKIVRPGGGEDLNSTGDFDITGSESVTIEPSGPSEKVRVDGNGLDRVFDQLGTSTLQIKNLTVTGGQTPVIEDGGGVRNGGAGTLTLDGVTVSDNQATVSGGGLAVYAGVTIVNSTITDNRSAGDGGGIYAAGGTALTVRSSTITGNEADFDANESGNGGGFNEAMATSVNFYNVINAGNLDGSSLPANQWPDCYSTSTSYFPRYVIQSQPFSVGSCLVGFNPPGQNQVTDPMLGPLQDNGGQTQTHALLAGSPAIGAGADGTVPGDACPALDQTGRDRPVGACDIGAVQYVEPTPPPGAAKLRIKKILPKKKQIRRGRKLKVKVVVQNTGNVAATQVKVCLKLKNRKSKKALKIKGKSCRKFTSIDAGTSVKSKIKLTTKKRASRGKYKVQAITKGSLLNVSKKSFKVKVR
ncbi:MAG: choice-of-anchor Q domain-containing protein [Solirubrobacterales bacterium]